MPLHCTTRTFTRLLCDSAQRFPQSSNKTGNSNLNFTGILLPESWLIFSLFFFFLPYVLIRPFFFLKEDILDGRYADIWMRAVENKSVVGFQAILWVTFIFSRSRVLPIAPIIRTASSMIHFTIRLTIVIFFTYNLSTCFGLETWNASTPFNFELSELSTFVLAAF